MTKASDNQFPKVILEERATDGSDTSNPAADHRALFLGEDGSLHLRDSAGTVTNVGGTETLPESIIDAAGDLIIGDGADSATRLAIGTAGQVLTVNAGATAPEWGAAPGGGSTTHSYLGYNTVGGTEDVTMVTAMIVAKPVTLAADGWIGGFDLYCEMVGTGTVSIRFAIYSDNAGAPYEVIWMNSPDAASALISTAPGPTSDPRWLGAAGGKFLVAGDYWIAFQLITTNQIGVFYDLDGASGQDLSFVSPGAYFTDWAYNGATVTDDGRKYSFRASLLTF